MPAPSPGSSSIASNTAWLFLDRLIRIVAGLLIGAWVARYLGPERFGELAFVIALTGIFQVVSQLGLDNIAIRDMSRTPESAVNILGTVFRLRLFSGAFCYLASLIAISLLRPTDTQALLLTAVIAAAILFQSADTVDLWFQSTLQSKKSVLARATAFLSSSSLKVLFIVLELPLMAFATLLLLEACLSAAALAYLYARKPISEKWCWNKLVSRVLLKEASPFLLSGLALTLYLQIDRLMLSSLMDSSALGLYSVALTISGAFNFIPIAICVSLAAKIANVPSHSDRVDFFVKLNALLLWLGIAFALTLYLSADFLIAILFGAQYQGSAQILKIHVFSLIFIFISVANDYFSLSMRNGKVTLMRTLAGLGINIALNSMLIPEWGIAGAAISSFSAHALSNTAVYWLLMPGSSQIFLSAFVLPMRQLKNYMFSPTSDSK